MPHWLQVRTPGGDIHLWHLGDLADDQLHNAVERVKAHHDVPPDWMDPNALELGDPTWVVALSTGEPHETLLAAGKVLDYSGLTVADETLAAHRDREAARTRDLQTAVAHAALSTLDPETLAAVISEHIDRAVG